MPTACNKSFFAPNQQQEILLNTNVQTNVDLDTTQKLLKIESKVFPNPHSCVRLSYVPLIVTWSKEHALKKTTEKSENGLLNGFLQKQNVLFKV